MPNTREKLIELLTEYFGVDPAYYGIETQHLVDHLIANGVTIQEDCHWATEQAYKNGYEKGLIDGLDSGYDKGYADGKPKWIPVTERLPEPLEDVLIFRGGQITSGFCDAKGGWFSYEFTTSEITHWMPLPEPPVLDNV